MLLILDFLGLDRRTLRLLLFGGPSTWSSLARLAIGRFWGCRCRIGRSIAVRLSWLAID